MLTGLHAHLEIGLERIRFQICSGVLTVPFTVVTEAFSFFKLTVVSCHGDLSIGSLHHSNLFLEGQQENISFQFAKMKSYVA